MQEETVYVESAISAAVIRTLLIRAGAKRIVMRYQGKMTSWNEDRGFGFIEWNGGNDTVFVHISAFADKRRRPVVGDIVTYEVTQAEKGRTRAEKVAFPSPTSRKVAAKPTRTLPFVLVAVAGLIAAVGVGASFLHKPQEVSTSRVLAAHPTAAVEVMFHCEGKTYCSQMSSCEEATFYLNHCPGTNMDGDRDGVPCESQWCRF